MCSNSWTGDADWLQFVTKVAQNGLSEASKKAPFWTFRSIPDPLDWNFSNIHVLQMTLEYLYPSCRIREEEFVVIFEKIVFAALGSAAHFRFQISGFSVSQLLLGRFHPFRGPDLLMREFGIEWAIQIRLYCIFWKSERPAKIDRFG